MTGRRIIYLKNPTQGSHFRVINGGDSSPRPPKAPRTPKTPKQPKAPGGIPSQNQYGGGFESSDWSNWAQGGDSPYLGMSISRNDFERALQTIISGQQPPQDDTPALAPGASVRSGPGGVYQGPYEAPIFEQFQQADTLWGMLYDIATGVDPYTGDYQPAYGAPGTLKFGAGTEWTSLAYETFDAGRGSRTDPISRFAGDYRIGGRPQNAGNRPWWAP